MQKIDTDTIAIRDASSGQFGNRDVDCEGVALTNGRSHKNADQLLFHRLNQHTGYRIKRTYADLHPEVRVEDIGDGPVTGEAVIA